MKCKNCAYLEGKIEALQHKIVEMAKDKDELRNKNSRLNKQLANYQFKGVLK